MHKSLSPLPNKKKSNGLFWTLGRILKFTQDFRLITVKSLRRRFRTFSRVYAYCFFIAQKYEKRQRARKKECHNIMSIIRSKGGKGRLHYRRITKKLNRWSPSSATLQLLYNHPIIQSRPGGPRLSCLSSSALVEENKNATSRAVSSLKV